MANFGPGEADDLAKLPRLDAKIILQELKHRYSKDKIYVRYDNVMHELNKTPNSLNQLSTIVFLKFWFIRALYFVFVPYKKKFSNFYFFSSKISDLCWRYSDCCQSIQDFEYLRQKCKYFCVCFN